MTTPTLDREADRITVRDMAKSTVFCPHTGVILTPKNTVVIRTWYTGKENDAALDVTHFSRWDAVKGKFEPLAKRRKIEYEVLDGRELF